MINNQNDNISSKSDVLSEEYKAKRTVENTVKAGSVLILALEDMIESLRGEGKNQGSYGKNSIYKSNKSLSLNDIKDKVINIKKLLRDFQSGLKDENTNTLKGIETEIRNMQKCGDYYAEEVLTDWHLISEADKAIDSTHELCYKIRELLRKIDR